MSDLRTVIQEVLGPLFDDFKKEVQKEVQKNVQMQLDKLTQDLKRVEDSNQAIIANLERLETTFVNWARPQSQDYNRRVGCGPENELQLVPFPDGSWPTGKDADDMKTRAVLDSLPAQRIQELVDSYKLDYPEGPSEETLRMELYMHLGLDQGFLYWDDEDDDMSGSDEASA